MTGKLVVSSSELVLGGQKSGKSRRAELLAGQWLGQSPTHRAVLIATAQPWDEEMRVRIQRHQSDRAARVPGLVTVEEPLQLAAALQRHSQPQTLVLAALSLAHDAEQERARRLDGERRHRDQLTTLLGRIDRALEQTPLPPPASVHPES